MSFTIREYKRGGAVRGLEVDIRVEMPDGRVVRERKKAPVTSKSGAERWAAAREREILTAGLAPRRRPRAKTLAEFWPRFLSDHARANGQKPSGIQSKEYGFRLLEPRLGHFAMDEITTADVQSFKAWLATDRKLATATINNTLALLSKVLKVAIEWDELGEMPCRITRLKDQQDTPGFYDFDEYERLVSAAQSVAPEAHLAVLLGGDAGLRRGEIVALERAKCDTRRKLIIVDRSEWRGQITETKGMEARVVPMTDRLCEAIRRHEEDGARLLSGIRGGEGAARSIRTWVERAQAIAKLPKATGELHVLRHTFCSHLAMRGVPATTIQKLAGHKSLQTTLRYMHLAEGETTRAIRVLEQSRRGEIVETAKNPAKVA